MAMIDPLDDQGYNPNDATPNSGVTGTGTPTTQGNPAPPPTTTPTDNRAGIASAYKQYLGRDIGENEYGYWTGNSNYADAIKNSAEAQQYSQTGQGGNYWNPGRAAEGFDQTKWSDRNFQSPKYTAGRILAAGGSIQQAAQAIGATVIDKTRMRLSSGEVIDIRRDEEGANALQWLVLGGGANAGNGFTTPGTNGGMGGMGGGGGLNAPSANGSAFSDPATSQWEQILRNLVNRLNTGIPDSAKELQQTQALDPMERQRQQLRQQEALRLSQRGITQDSGVYRDAMSNIDRQFNELRTRTQASFADSWAQNEDGRMMQAANLFKQIPQYQDTRLQLAQNSLMPTNVGSLLNLQQQGNQMNTMQQQQFYAQLMQALGNLFTNG